MFKANRQKPLNDEHIQRTRHYFSIAWKEAHQPDVAVIAVPLNIGRQKALKQVKKLTDRHAVDLFKPPKPKYQLADKDMHVKGLIDDMAVLYMRAVKPDFKLWQVGVEANISKSYSKLFDSKTTKRNANNSDELRHLEMMTSRKYRQARHIAENAARGIFPSMKPPPHSVAFDPKEFKRVIGAKIRWKKAAIAQLQTQADLMEQTPADKAVDPHKD